MSEDTRDQTLDSIQDIANFLSLRDDLSDDVPEYLDIIEALARHRDIGPDVLDNRQKQMLANMSLVIE